MTIGYKVPVSDIVLAWSEQQAKYEMDLQEALRTQMDLKSKDVDDSCVNGKVESARRNILVLTLQIKYINRDDDVYLLDHEVMNIFMAPMNLGGPDQAVTERRY
jgi:myo-inositol-1-phosphate synthase